MEFVTGVSTNVNLNTENYLNDLVESSKLKILNQKLVNDLYNSEVYVGLFKCFLRMYFMKKVLCWTNTNLMFKDKRFIDLDGLFCFFGLEIASSIVKYNQLRDYWNHGKFLGHNDFIDTMGRDRFLTTRSFLKIHPHINFCENSFIYPLWHRKYLINTSTVIVFT